MNYRFDYTRSVRCDISCNRIY